MSLAFTGVLIPIAAIALIIFGIQKLRSGDAHGALQGHSVRRFFQYLLLYALIVVSALGLSGLLGRVLEPSTLVVADKTDLARSLSFVVVGIPLYIVLAFWTRRRFSEDASEAKSFGWGFYLTMTSITSLIVGMFALHDMVGWAVRDEDFRASALARLIVWGVVWGVHWWVQGHSTRVASARAHHLLGSIIALGTVVVGVDQLISGAIQRIWNIGGDRILLFHGDSILRSATTFIVGAPIWYLYWIRNYSKATRDPLWFSYVLLAGVGGGLLVSVVSASTLLYNVLVWFIGDAGTTEAATHFHAVPSAFGAVCVGVITWWYHHAILEEDRTTMRTEVQRVYEYLMAGIGLLAAAGGLAMILVALVEALTSSSLISGSGATNALLAALTLLLVGTPVWWIYWRRITTAVRLSPEAEHASPTRRIYLFILFGLGGLVAVATLLVGVFSIFDDIFKGSFGQETIRRIRFALSILITTGAIAGYHWLIYRSERELMISDVRGPALVILVGPKDDDLGRSISQMTGGRVQSWMRKDDQAGIWSTDQVIQALEQSKEEAVILLAESNGLQVIPIERG